MESEGRQMLMTQVIKMLTVTIPRERSGGSERRMRRPRRRDQPNDAAKDKHNDAAQ